MPRCKPKDLQSLSLLGKHISKNHPTIVGVNLEQPENPSCREPAIRHGGNQPCKSTTDGTPGMACQSRAASDGEVNRARWVVR
jgi:hypothetical protein